MTNTEHALPISDEELAKLEDHFRHMTDGHWHDECEYCLARRTGYGLTTPLSGLVARIRELEARPQVNEAGVIAELRAWLENRSPTTTVLGGAVEVGLSVALIKLDELVAQHAEQARAERVAEAAMAFEWLFLNTEPSSRLAADESELLEAAEAYVAAQEQAGA